MSVVYNVRKLGLWDNGDFESGTNSGFTFGTIYTDMSHRGLYSLLMETNNQQVQGSQFIEVDTSKFYRMTVKARTIARSTPNNYLGGGYLGFATYDQFYNFVDLRNCGGVGNTTLSRALNPGDSYAYITSSSGWSTAAEYYYRHFMINPSTHPYYSSAWGYTRIGFGDTTLCYSPTIVNTGTDFRLTLQDANGNPITMPNIGYSLPIGTPVFNGVAGGTYNYVFGNPSHSDTSWSNYDSGWFTGENRNSSLPFRQGTKYIKFMVLSNYAMSETVAPKYVFDDIMLYKSASNTGNVPI